MKFSLADRRIWMAIAGLLLMYGAFCLIGHSRSPEENIWGIGILFIVLGSIGLLVSFNALSVSFLRIVRWVVLLWYHVAYTPVVVLLLAAFITRVNWIEACLDKCLFSPYFDIFMWPGIVANAVNGVILMLEGRRRAHWSSWRQLASLWAIALPVFGVFYYAKCEREFRLLQGTQQDYGPKL